MHPFRLADLIDYETQIARDRSLSIEELRTRDESVARRISNLPQSMRRLTVLRSWLDTMRQEEVGPWLGGLWQNCWLLLAWIAAGAGVISGWGAVRLLFAYDGSRPINIIPILGLYVLLQLLFLLALGLRHGLARFFLRHLLPDRQGLSWFHSQLMTGLQALMGSRLNFAKSSGPVRDAWLRFRKLYGGLEQLALWQVLQLFGLSFHLSSLFTCFYLVSFYDLAFAWSTTLHLPPETLHRILLVIAWPFSWVSPDLVPTSALIDATQYIRFEDRFAASPLGPRSLDAASARAWWPYLALCMLSYGAIPRFLLWIGSRLSLRRELARLKLDDPASESLWRRLSEASGLWTKDGAGTPPGPLALGDGQRRPRVHVDSPASSCIVLKWLDAPFADAQIREHLRQRFGFQTEHILPYAGTKKDQAAFLDALKPQQKQSHPTVLCITEAWELPGEAAEKLIRQVREQQVVPITFLFAPLVDRDGQLENAGEKDLALWRLTVTSFGDPYLGLLVDYGERS